LRETLLQCNQVEFTEEIMSAFIIVDTKINNPEAYDEYKALARPLVEKFGGIYRVRGGEIDTYETALWAPTRIVVLEFPSREQANIFLKSEEYAPVKAKRLADADCTTFVVDGV
jgi:uncharacterized protein (DUF1330 family)